MQKRLCAVVAVVLATVALGAREQRPLPAFSVVAAGGETRASGALSAEPRWVLMYVTPGCRSCDRLLQALKDWQSPQLLARTVVIVRGPSAAAAAYIGERLPQEAAGVAWYADQAGEGAQALDLKGAPVLLGVERGEIKWTISGVLNDPKALESAVRTWVEY
jgi:hypothetical protein